MNEDLSAVVDAVLERLPEPLADRRARAALRTVASLLPASLRTGPLGLEIRLAGPTAVDLFGSAVPGGTSFGALVDALAVPRRSPAWVDARRARELADVLRRWERGEGALPAVARYLLIEVDAPDDPTGPVAVPSVFLSPRGNRDVPRPGAGPNAFHRLVDATTTACAELAGVWPDPATADALGRVVAAVPADADVFAVGAMVGRAAGPSMRLAVRRLPDEGVHAVLAAAGRRPQADVLAGMLADSPAARRDIAFEVGPGAEPRVGLELSPGHGWAQARTEGWPELLDDLVRRGLAEPERAATVPGLVDPDGDPRWGLAHVKVAADGSGLLPGSKLYVGLGHGGALR